MDRFTIVLAVDFSPPSAAALRLASGLARRTDARVVLVHALGHTPREPEGDLAPATPRTSSWAQRSTTAPTWS